MFTVPIKVAKAAVKQLKKVVKATRSPHVLGYVRFHPSKGIVTGNDLEQSVEFNLDVRSESPDFVIPLAELSDILSNQRSGDVAFEPTESGASTLVRFTVGDNPIERQFESVPLDEWLDIDIPDEQMATLSVGSDFFDNYRNAAKIVSKDGTRLALQHVCIDDENIAAGNGRIQVAFAHGLALEHEFLLPVTKLLDAKAAFSDGATIRLFGKDRPEVCQIESEEMIYTCKVPDLSYPNYRMVFPSVDSEDRLVVVSSNTAPDLIEVIDQFHVEDKQNLSVTMLSGETGAHLIGEGAAPEVLSIDAEVAGPNAPMAVTVNRNYLKYAWNSGFTELRFKGTTKPVTASAGESKLVFMPLRGGRSVEQCQSLVGQSTAPQETDDTESPTKETESMPEEKQQGKPNLSVVNNSNNDTQADPFDELAEFAKELTEKTKDVNAMVREIPKRVRALKSSIKQKDKAFAQARQVLDQLQKIA